MVIESGAGFARYALDRPILGARLIKGFTLRDGHPFLYERHVFVGGNGAVPVANHGMTRFDAPGTISFSPKLFGETPSTSLEPDPKRGRSRLAYPSHFTDPSRVPTADGGVADLTRYPFAAEHEDFVALVERPGNPLGWAAALRPDKRDIFLSLKDPADYPITMMCFSNGGRDYAPWNSRHRGVLGLEEGRSYGGHGHKASIAENPWTRQGIATSLVLDPTGEVAVRNVIGGIALPEGWSKIAEVEAEDAELTLIEALGRKCTVPFDGTFLRPSR
jgi:hypothetical protein